MDLLMSRVLEEGHRKPFQVTPSPKSLFQFATVRSLSFVSYAFLLMWYADVCDERYVLARMA